MKKSDFKTGMWIELRNSKKAMVLLNTDRGDIFSGIDTWGNLESYSEDLIYKGIGGCDDSKFIYENSIVKVYNPSSNEHTYNFDKEYYNHNCIWERKGVKSKLIKINAVINAESIKDIENAIAELQDKLDSLKINLELNDDWGYGGLL